MRRLLDRSAHCPQRWSPAMKLFTAALTPSTLLVLHGFFAAAPWSGATTAVAFLLVVGLPAAGAGLLARSRFHERLRLAGPRAPLHQHNIDAEILRLASDRDGRLTAAVVAAELDIPSEEAKRALGDLLLRQHADPELTDTGVMVYHFYDVCRLEGKLSPRRRSSSDPLTYNHHARPL